MLKFTITCAEKSSARRKSSWRKFERYNIRTPIHHKNVIKMSTLFSPSFFCSVSLPLSSFAPSLGLSLFLSYFISCYVFSHLVSPSLSPVSLASSLSPVSLPGLSQPQAGAHDGGVSYAALVLDPRVARAGDAAGASATSAAAALPLTAPVSPAPQLFL